MQPAEITPAATKRSRLRLNDVIYRECVPFHCCWGWWECTEWFLSLVSLTFDLDIQTRPSEGRNTSSLGISHKSVQQFPRYLIRKQRLLFNPGLARQWERVKMSREQKKELNKTMQKNYVHLPGYHAISIMTLTWFLLPDEIFVYPSNVTFLLFCNSLISRSNMLPCC